MQFIANGPDIPNALLQAHAEGRVVFFCGAGISYPADLPGFKGLVEHIYSKLGTGFHGVEQSAFKQGQYDVTLGLLERRHTGQRRAIRQALANVLQPNLQCKGATDTHTALLKLARCREGALRLVTTNFDRLFHEVKRRDGVTFHEYAAPMLPVPKSSRWDGLVFLHGLLPESEDDTALNQLVFTSGDFGLAYLTERWAARFVSELFRSYVVCFVGYSINDPVLRYMTDALAADRLLGETTPQAWAFGECEPGQESVQDEHWKAKGVTPILYHKPKGSHDHSVLHHTLHVWAKTYDDGALGKERIVVEHALARPSASTPQDNFVARMLWALSDPSGLPAKRFADHKPTPPLEWLLEAFSAHYFSHHDLPQFGVTPPAVMSKDLAYSLVCRPAPDGKAPNMKLAGGLHVYPMWDKVMEQIGRWTLQYLGDPRLVLWVAQRGGQLHPRWRFQIEDQLKKWAQKERKGEAVVPEEEAPQSIPDSRMRVLWRLILCGRVKLSGGRFEIYDWLDQVKRDGLTATLRMAARELLAPKITMRPSFHWRNDFAVRNDVVECDLELSTDHVRALVRYEHDIKEVFESPSWLDDLQRLLRDALDLLCEVGKADERRDYSYAYLPAIEPAGQDWGIADWVVLIELLRDAWLALYRTDRRRAARVAEAWFELPYPTFKRLALFAAKQEACIRPAQWVTWLLADGAHWLWTADTEKEVFGLLMHQGRSLIGKVQARLEKAILAGPPRMMYRDDLEPEQWQQRKDYSTWHHLTALAATGLDLGDEATELRLTLTEANPLWKLWVQEQDESDGMGEIVQPGIHDDQIRREVGTISRRKLVQLLRSPQPNLPVSADDLWYELCRHSRRRSLCTLIDFARQDYWPIKFWELALDLWGTNSKAKGLRTWRHAAATIVAMPAKVLLEMPHAVSRWLRERSQSIPPQDAFMLTLCQRILDLPLKAETGIMIDGKEGNRPMTDAINHPVGHVTEALINRWFKQNPQDGDLLPADIKPFFTALCDTNVARFRHGRVMLSARLIALFRVDKAWTKRYLLPLFDWSNPAEARAVWGGFLWSPRVYLPLLLAFKRSFLACAAHYEALGALRQRYADYLTHVALYAPEGYEETEFRDAFATLPMDGLGAAAQTLRQALEGSAGQREVYWGKPGHPCAGTHLASVS